MDKKLNTLNLIQVIGGINIKQGDISLELSFQLCDSKGDPISFLNAKDASIHLYSEEKKLEWTCKTKVNEDKISFKIDEPLAIGSYKIEIKIDGHIFPSDQGTYIRIIKGYESYTDSESAIVAIENAKNIASEAIKKAISENAEKFKGPKGDSLKFDDLTDEQKEELRGKQGLPGQDIKVVSSNFDSDGNTIVSFNNNSPDVKIQKGETGKPFKFEDMTDEQKKSLQVDVVNNLSTGGKDKALSAEQGKYLFDLIAKYHPEIKLRVMTAVIDQSNPDPLACITYEDDAKSMEKGSSKWDDFFQSQLVLFKDGKEVRELEDSELNDLKPEDGDVMVRFPRKGLRIKTVDEKVYVSMTNATDDPEFKYYAHSRGNQRKDNFYLGAYLGFEESGKLRSITGKAPTGSKTIGDSRKIAQANGAGYEQLAFYQWTFLQAMYVLKYGNLDSQTALGKGNTSGGNYKKITGETNGKSIDFGSTDNKTKVRFQWIEDLYGTRSQWLDGFKTENGKIWTGTDRFSNEISNYQGYDAYEEIGYPKKIIGNDELGFIIKERYIGSSVNYSDYQVLKPSGDFIAMVGGAMSGAGSGVFNLSADCSAHSSYGDVGARLMYL
jgi:hypothetical protein